MTPHQQQPQAQPANGAGKANWFVFRGEQRIAGPVTESDARAQAETLRRALSESNKVMAETITFRQSLFG